MVPRIATALLLMVSTAVARAQWDEGMVVAYCAVEARFDWLVDLCKQRATDRASIGVMENAVSRWRELHAEALPHLRQHCQASQHLSSALAYFYQEREIVEQRLRGATHDEINNMCRASDKSVFHPQYNVSQVVRVNPLPER